MPKSEYKRRMVNLELCDYEYIWRVAQQKGLGWRGFSQALRLILREHQSLFEDGQGGSSVRPAPPGPPRSVAG